MKDDYEERDKTQIMWGGLNVCSLSDASANWRILFISQKMVPSFEDGPKVVLYSFCQGQNYFDLCQ